MIVRWSPTDDMNRMENLMKRFFDHARQSSTEESRITRPEWIPPVDAWETEEGFHLTFDIPGVSKETIEIEVDNDKLTVKGERKTPDDINYLRQERVYGSFLRTFTLDTPIERENIKATYKQGVLDILLPKPEEVKPKQIKVEIIEEE